MSEWQPIETASKDEAKRVIEGLEYVAGQIKHEYPASYQLVMNAIEALRADSGEKVR